MFIYNSPLHQKPELRLIPPEYITETKSIARLSKCLNNTIRSHLAFPLLSVYICAFIIIIIFFTKVYSNNESLILASAKRVQFPVRFSERRDKRLSLSNHWKELIHPPVVPRMPAAAIRSVGSTGRTGEDKATIHLWPWYYQPYSPSVSDIA